MLHISTLQQCRADPIPGAASHVVNDAHNFVQLTTSIYTKADTTDHEPTAHNARSELMVTNTDRYITHATCVMV